MRNSEKQAFPCPHSPELNSMDGSDGLTKREYFAGLAMQGLLASNDGRESDVTARHSIELADALLAELEKTAKK